MNDPVLVSCLERFGDLTRDCERFGDRDWSRRDALGERVAVDEFQNQSRRTAQIVQVVDGADVWMVQRCEESGFAIETAAALGIAAEDGWEDLDGDVTTELRILRTIHVAHAAGAKERDDAMGAKLSADQRLIAVFGSYELQRRRVQKVTRTACVREQRFDLASKRFVTRARLVQKGRTFIRRAFERRLEQTIDSGPARILHL
jgi:hypothetical protein